MADTYRVTGQRQFKKFDSATGAVRDSYEVFAETADGHPFSIDVPLTHYVPEIVNKLLAERAATMMQVAEL